MHLKFQVMSVPHNPPKTPNFSKPLNSFNERDFVEKEMSEIDNLWVAIFRQQLKVEMNQIQPS